MRPPDPCVSKPAAEALMRPHEDLASAIQNLIDDGDFPPGVFVPSAKGLAAAHDVAVATARQALTLLNERGRIEIVPGRGFRVASLAQPHPDGRHQPLPEIVAVPPIPAEAPTEPQLLDFVVRHRGEELTRFSAEADPRSAVGLHSLLVEAIHRRGGDAEQIAEYELELRRAGEQALIATFVVSQARHR